MTLSSEAMGRMACFSRVSEMKQNQASFATGLSIIWRIESNTIKYRRIRLNAIELCAKR